MTDGAVSPSALLESLSPAHRRALLDYTRWAVLTLNGGLSTRCNQPAQTPADAETWRDALSLDAVGPLIEFWAVLEEAPLRAAGVFAILAIFRHAIDQAQAGFDLYRQNNIQLPSVTAAPPTSPAPGSAA